MTDTATREQNTSALRSPNKRRGSSRIPAGSSALSRWDAKIAAPSSSDNNQPDISANAIRGPPRLWDCATTCAFFGGIDVSTLYRGVNSRPLPAPGERFRTTWCAGSLTSAKPRATHDRRAWRHPKPPTQRGRPRRKIIT